MLKPVHFHWAILWQVFPISVAWTETIVKWLSCMLFPKSATMRSNTRQQTLSLYSSLCVCVCVRACKCVCVCVCVCAFFILFFVCFFVGQMSMWDMKSVLEMKTANSEKTHFTGWLTSLNGGDKLASGCHFFFFYPEVFQWLSNKSSNQL